MKITQIDLNSDLGEGFGPWGMGDDQAMLDIVSSANIACGAHAGDPETMFKTLKLAAARNVVVGAHPGYADRAGFGRRIIPMSAVEIGRMVAAQIGALQGVAALAGAKIAYVKPHGALANVACDDQGIAQVIVQAVRAISPNLAILAISGTELQRAAAAKDMQLFSEIYADRACLRNGRLVPRSQPNAVITDPKAAADRLLAYVATGQMQTIEGNTIPLEGHSICVHGDSVGAVAMATHIRQALEGAGVHIKPFISQ